MLLKWIKCIVPKANKETFSKAQRKWMATAASKGFVEQLGGWNKLNPKEANIFALWEHREALADFMRFYHDDIYKKTGQKGMYEKIDIVILEGEEMDLRRQIHEVAIDIEPTWLFRAEPLLEH